MTEREDVIRRIENVLQLTHKESLTVTIPRYTAELVVSMLEEQKPRVMTLEEVKAFEWDYCYLEQERQPGNEYRMNAGDYLLTCITWPCIASMRIEYGDSSYGIKWRCWTSRPTDEQRKAVKWE